MFTIELFYFGKEENSTARPSGAGMKLDINLKSECSIMNPVVSVRFPNDLFTPHNLNYAYIPAFQRYYYITNWAWSAGLWFASLRIDVLATWWDKLRNSEQYVLRSEADFDGTITDTVYPVVGSPQFARYDAQKIHASAFSEGRYVIGVINPDVQGVGAVSYYVMTQAEMNNFKNFLLGSADYLQVSDTAWVDENILKSVFNPFQYVASCMWVPYIPPMESAQVTGIKFGWWVAPSLTAHRLKDNSVYNQYIEIPNIPRHPQAEERGEYLNRSPYTMYNIRVPGFGLVPVDSTWIEHETTFRVQLHHDPVTGTTIMRVFAVNPVGSAALVYESMAQIGINIQLAQITNNVLGATHVAIDTAASVAKSATKLDAIGAVSSAASGALSTFECLIPSVSTTNINGSIAPYDLTASLNATFYLIAEEDIHHNGRPLMQVRDIGELPGYLRIANPHVDFAGITKDEQTELIQLMQNGFIMEGVG